MAERWALIGFGEVARHMVRHFGPRGIAFAAYTRSPDRSEAAARDLDVPLCCDLPEALRGSSLVISCVWPTTALEVAAAAAPALGPGHLLVDVNSVAPSVAAEVARLAEGRGARFAKVAILSRVFTARGPLELLAGGGAAGELADLWGGLGQPVTVLGEDPRQPAAFKILRSLVLKGLTGVAFEALTAAARYGLADAVLESAAGFLDSPGLAPVLRESMRSFVAHAVRRAGEMDEVADALQSVGVEPRIAPAVRETFLALADLWDGAGQAHPTWDGLLEGLRAPRDGALRSGPGAAGES